MKKILILIFTFTIFLVNAQKNSGFSDDNRKTTGICLTTSGIAFTAAAILESASQYGTYVTTKPATSKSTQQVSYVKPPVYQQTPRNIMFVVGISLTITGLFTMMSGK